jgi:hypothetical protein
VDRIEAELAMSDQPWSRAAIEACVHGLAASVRKWPTEAVLKAFAAVAQVLDERSELAGALNQQLALRAQSGASAMPSENLEARVDVTSPTKGCLFGTAVGAVGLIALLVVGFAVLVVAGWRWMLGGVR